MLGHNLTLANWRAAQCKDDLDNDDENDNDGGDVDDHVVGDNS